MYQYIFIIQIAGITTAMIIRQWNIGRNEQIFQFYYLSKGIYLFFSSAFILWMRWSRCIFLTFCLMWLIRPFSLVINVHRVFIMLHQHITRFVSSCLLVSVIVLCVALNYITFCVWLNDVTLFCLSLSLHVDWTDIRFM